MIKTTEIENIIEDIKSSIKSNMEIATIGLSGGADSTLVACLCVLALGKENVYGYGMPYNKLDAKTFNLRSANLATKLEINYRTFSITNSVSAVKKEMTGPGTALSTINEGNLRSRMRMIYLYTLNCKLGETLKKRARVLGTGNLSEDFIGYDTKGGDALADFFPIGELYKSEVYQLLDYFVEIGMLNEDMIDRIPSAGLWNGQTDEEELGYSYDEMEPIIQVCLENYDTIGTEWIDLWYTGNEATLFHFIWNRHIANKHKHMVTANIKFINSRFERRLP
jgi:NAD+ synthase